MSAYWVKWEGQLKGPYGLDGIEKLVEREAITAETPLQPTGQDQWFRAKDLPEVAEVLRVYLPSTVVMAQLPLVAPRPAPAMPLPPAPKRRGALKLVLGIVLGVLLGGGVIAAVVLIQSGAEPAFSEELLAEALPSQVQSLIVIRTPEGEDQTDETRGLRVSAIAPLCGGSDIGERLMHAHGRDVQALAGDGTLDVLRGEHLQEYLQCSARLDAAMGRFHFYLVGFEDGDLDRTVGVLRLTDLADPPFPNAHNFSGLEGRCRPSANDPAQCASDESAYARRGDLWAFGNAEAVAAYAREWNRGAERSATTNMEYARVLAEEIDSDALLSAVYVRPEALPFGDICSAVPGGFLACLPDDVSDTLTRIRTSIRGVSIAIRTPDVDRFDPTVSWTMSFAARDEADADDVSRDLEELVRDWRAHLENRQASFIETIRSAAAQDADQREAMLRSFVRAMGAAEVEVDGRIARIVAQDELSEAEQREVTAHLDRQRAIRQAASRVVLAVHDGETPDRADLNRLVGEAAADWMLQPRATQAQCDAIQARIAALSGPNMPTQDFGALFRARQRFGPDGCVGRVMPTELATCVTNAQSATAMEACPPVIPPWGPQPIEETHRGELTDSDPRVRDDQSPYDTYTIEVGAGWTIEAEMTSAVFDAYLWLIGPDGSSLVQDDDGGGGTNARFSFRATAAGTYTVRANSFEGGGRGAYVLTIRAR